jgi:2-polyprenyl-3-methyl-5-hydroxy-6-metoxy-1,4-benzoquinol methylase
MSSTEAGALLDSLVTRLEEFYRTYTKYSAFAQPTDQRSWLELIEHELRGKLRNSATITVLEVGAGAGSVFSGLSNSEKSTVEYTAQDITLLTIDSLRRVADKIHIGPVEDLKGEFDLIYSLFVFEHIPRPEDFLTCIDRLLKPGGTHIVVCPRYDFPGYICPSLRHRRAGELLKLEATKILDRIRNRVRHGAPVFWINHDPAVFHKKWRRDADAVHLVSKAPVLSWHHARQYKFRPLRPRTSGAVEWFFKNSLILSAAFDKPISTRRGGN